MKTKTVRWAAGQSGAILSLCLLSVKLLGGKLLDGKPLVPSQYGRGSGKNQVYTVLEEVGESVTLFAVAVAHLSFRSDGARSPVALHICSEPPSVASIAPRA